MSERNRQPSGRERPVVSSKDEVVENVLASLPRPARILDAGCGQGMPVLIRVGESITGVGLDISRGPLLRTRLNAPHSAPIQGDMCAPPFREGIFDAAIACDSIGHVPVDHHGTVVDEFGRVLRSGGRLLLTTGRTELKGVSPSSPGHFPDITFRNTLLKNLRDRLIGTGFAILDEGVIVNERRSTDGSESRFVLARYDA